MAQTTANVPLTVCEDTKLTRYLQEQPDPKDNPLTWWRDNQTCYPLMWKLARRYMSTALERMFSTAGNIVTPAHSCLKLDKVNKLTLLAQNLELEVEDDA